MKKQTADGDSIGVQGDNTVDKGLISAPFALLSLRVRPVRVDQVPERGRNYTVWSVLPLVHRCYHMCRTKENIRKDWN